MARPILSWLRSDRPVTPRSCQWDAWGCPSFFSFSPRPAFIRIYNSDHPLSARMDMHMLDHDRLAISAPAPIEGLEKVVLKLEKSVGIRAIDDDVFLAQMALTQLHHAQRRKPGDDELHGNQGFDLG